MQRHRGPLIVFGLLAALLFGGEAAAWLAGGLVLAGVGWVLCATLTMLLAAVGTLLVGQLVLVPMTSREAALIAELRERAEERRQLRHDLRGALSPALLTVDRLLANADPSVRRAGEMTLRAVERASALLLEGDDEGVETR